MLGALEQSEIPTGWHNISLQSTTNEPNATNHHTEGLVVPIEKVPYQVAVFESEKLVCGGSIIGPRWILTSFHCVITQEPSGYSVVVGTDDPQKGNKLGVDSFVVPQHLLPEVSFDIALLKLLKRLDFSSKVQCIPLLKSLDELVLGKPAHVSGYGVTVDAGREKGLRVVTVVLLQNKRCELANGWKLKEFMFCAGFEMGEMHTCQGDSGGPLVMDSKLAGIVYYGEECINPIHPGVYLSIPWFYDWIVNVDEEANVNNMIVGGFKVNIEEVPFQVALYMESLNHCGGSIIGPRWILTTYHCVKTLNPSDYKIVAGTAIPKDGTQLPVEKLYLLEETAYDPSYDIALAKLSTSLVYSATVQCIQLQTSPDAIVPGKQAYISGYGSIKEGGENLTLKGTTIAILPWEKCQQAYDLPMQSHLFCAGFEQGEVDACKGDSGGPLVVDKKLTGIIYFGRGCARPGQPGVYISVPAMHNWITSVVHTRFNLAVAVVLALLVVVLLPFTQAQEQDGEDGGTNMVVGGFKVSIEEVPYQVALYIRGQNLCGGSIIGSRWVLTSYHCVKSIKPRELQVVVGNSKPINGKRISVQKVYIPPQIRSDQSYDVALLKLGTSLVYSKSVRCIPMQTSSATVIPGKPAYISGYGSVREGGRESPLKAATVNVLPWKSCQDAYNLAKESHLFCAGYEEGEVDTCQGDSGGPLVVEKKLSGVVYFGRGCARAGLPGVYVSVPAMYDWITSVVQSEPSEEERKLC
uniref:trypsin n=1 Tax=Anopheles epiroticus TaxID=199890 RepID=A0A182PCP9_9DIPT